MKREIKNLLKKYGFNGKVEFRKSVEFKKNENNALHFLLHSLSELVDLSESAQRNFRDHIVIYLEPKSFYFYMNNLANPKHIWTESEIRGLKKCLGAFSTSWSRMALDHAYLAIECLNIGFRITKQQTNFGLEWLHKTQFKRNGELRKTSFLGFDEALVIKKFKRFEFVGFELSHWHSDKGFMSITPIYRVVSKNGRFFEYAAAAFGNSVLTQETA